MRAVTAAAVAVLLSGSAAAAQDLAIAHGAAGCLVAGRNAKIAACITPAGGVARARVYFRPQADPAWYWVEMAEAGACHEAVLPRPKRSLAGTKVFYYVEAVGREVSSARTAEVATEVVRREADCRLGVAPLASAAPTAVHPVLPGGFGGGAGATAVVIGAGAAAAAAGVALAAGGGGEPAAPSTTSPGGPPSTTAGTSPATTPPTTTPSDFPPLVVACEASPRTGDAPLPVSFNASANGGTGSYEYLWAFGDGGESRNPSPGHTYESPGSYEAVLRVASGQQIGGCSRTIEVRRPVPVPTRFRLDVDVSGITGNGPTSVGSSPGSINCRFPPLAGDRCSESFDPGTLVTLTAATPPVHGGGGLSWSGACDRILPGPNISLCEVRMDADKRIAVRGP